MMIRILSSVVLLPPVLAAIWFGGVFFGGLTILMGVIAIAEWWRICSGVEQNSSIMAAAEKIGKSGGFWPIIGLFYISVAVLSLLWLRSQDDGGRYLIILFFCAVWATDIGAYVFGRAIGGVKLAPKISPNKTWAGLIGGILCAGAVVGLIVHFAPDEISAIFPNLLEKNLGRIILVTAAGILAVVAQGGDLFESWFKRRFGVKDSGNIIPGHGGVLDRVDGVLLGAPMTAVVLFLFQGEA